MAVSPKPAITIRVIAKASMVWPGSGPCEFRQPCVIALRSLQYPPVIRRLVFSPPGVLEPCRRGCWPRRDPSVVRRRSFRFKFLGWCAVDRRARPAAASNARSLPCARPAAVPHRCRGSVSCSSNTQQCRGAGPPPRGGATTAAAHHREGSEASRPRTRLSRAMRASPAKRY